MEKDVWINERTGERVEAVSSIRRVARENFEIVYLSYLLDLFDKLGGKKYQVLKYIIAHKNTDNLVISTTREMAENLKLSRTTVIKALEMLREAGLIKTKTGVIILNAKLLCRGSAAKEAYIMQKFEAFDKSPEEPEPQQATLPLSR